MVWVLLQTFGENECFCYITPMKYQEFAPSQALKKFVCSFWIASTTDITPSSSKILPDGFIDIIIETNQKAIKDIRVSGMMTKYKQVVVNPQAEVLGVRLKPGSFHALTGVPASELKNSALPALDVLPKFEQSFQDHFLEQETSVDKVCLFEHFLVNHFAKPQATFDELAKSVCMAIYASYQSIDFMEVARQYHIGLRQLERRFKKAVGVTMKEYQAIVRFCQTLESISQNNRKSLLHIAFDHGYYDHAHLTKEISRMAGVAPSYL